MKKYLITGGFLFVGIVLILFVFTQIPLGEVLETFEGGSPIAVFIFLFISVLIMALQAWRWQIIINTHGYNPPFIKTFLYKIVGFGISFITPFAKVGGEPLRAALLAKHDCPLDKGLSTVAIDKLIDLTTTGAMFVIAALIAITQVALPDSMRLLFILLSIIFTLIIGNTYYQLLNDNKAIVKTFKFLRLHKIKRLKNIEQTLVEFDDRMVHFHKKQTKAFYKTLAISIVTWLLMFVEYKAVLWIFGYDLGFLELFVIITIMGAAYVFPIPLALGVFEYGQAQTFSLLGLKAAAGIGLSFLVRARDLTWTFIAIIILFTHGKNFKDAYNITMKQTKLTQKQDKT